MRGIRVLRTRVRRKSKAGGLTIGGRYAPINRTTGYARLGFCQGEKCPWHGKKGV